jgi:hypothetical protein
MSDKSEAELRALFERAMAELGPEITGSIEASIMTAYDELASLGADCKTIGQVLHVIGCSLVREPG